MSFPLLLSQAAWTFNAPSWPVQPGPWSNLSVLSVRFLSSKRNREENTQKLKNPIDYPLSHRYSPVRPQVRQVEPEHTDRGDERVRHHAVHGPLRSSAPSILRWSAVGGESIDRRAFVGHQGAHQGAQSTWSCGCRSVFLGGAAGRSGNVQNVQSTYRRERCEAMKPLPARPTRHDPLSPLYTNQPRKWGKRGDNDARLTTHHGWLGVDRPMTGGTDCTD